MLNDLAAIAAGISLSSVATYILNQVSDTAKDVVSGWASDKIKDLLSAKDAKSLVSSGVRLFLYAFEQELLDAGETSLTVKAYSESLKSFLLDEEVQSELGQSLGLQDGGPRNPDSVVLAKVWIRDSHEPLPDDFDWIKVARRYSRHALQVLEQQQGYRERVLARAALHISREGTTEPQSDDSLALEKYAKAIRLRYGYVKIDALDANPDHARLLLSSVFVEPSLRQVDTRVLSSHEWPVELSKTLVESHATKQFELSNQQQDIDRRLDYFRQVPTPALTILEDPKHRLQAVLGSPGAGKSSLLAHFALRWAEDKPNQRSAKPLPILVELRQYAGWLAANSQAGLFTFLQQAPEAVWQFPTREMRNNFAMGSAYLLLDGLDEIFDPSIRAIVVSEIVRYSVEYPKLRIILTARVVGHESSASVLRDADFSHWIVQDFDEGQQSAFISKWHALAYLQPKEREDKEQRIRRSLERVRSVRDMAGNPLLLTLMSLLNRHHELPRDRNALYERATALLLEQWDVNKSLKQDPELERLSLDHSDKQLILRAVALQMQSSNNGAKGNAIRESNLISIVDRCLKEEFHVEVSRPAAVRLVRQLRERNYILCLLGADMYAFVHRSFLEFFCAWAWIWKYKEAAESNRISLDQLIDETIARHISDERWFEVLRLIVARLASGDAEIAIERILNLESTAPQTAVWLAASCYSEFRNPARDKELADKLASRLLAWTTQKVPGMLTDELESERTRSLVAFGRIAEIDGQRLKEYLTTRATSDPDFVSRQAAITALLHTWLKDEEVQRFVLHTSVNDSHWAVRHTALSELAVLLNPNDSLRAHLQRAVVEDDDSIVRATCVRQLVRIWPADAELYEWFRLVLHQSEDSALSAALTQALSLKPILLTR